MKDYFVVSAILVVAMLAFALPVFTQTETLRQRSLRLLQRNMPLNLHRLL